MPAPQSQRGNPITGSNFEAPFETPVFPLGVGGLDLASPVDRVALGRFTRLTNTYMLASGPGGLTGRAGLTQLATGTGNFHTIARFSDPANSVSTFLWGVGTTVALATSGAVTVVSTGFSGDPMTLLPYHPPLSGEPWMYVADRTKMVKVRFDGLALPIALPAPLTAAVLTLATIQSTPVVAFDSSDGSQAANWTFHAFSRITTLDHRAGPIPTTSVGDAAAGAGVTFTLSPNGVTQTAEVMYGATWGLPKTLNLSVVGADAASDPDAMQIRVALLNPSAITEMRLYLVCSPVFSTAIIPGTGGGGATPRGVPLTSGANTDFFVKAFRPDDFAPYLAPFQAAITGAGVAKPRFQDTHELTIASDDRGFGPVVDHEVQRVDASFLETADPRRAAPKQAGGSNQQVVAYGTIGIPLRRGEFRRYGSTAGGDWSTITGIMVYISTTVPANAAPNPADVGMTLDLWQMTGGSGPDTMEPDTQSYDVRYTNLDPRTGDESNPSPTMADTAFLDTIRTSIIATPAAYGDAAIRQRFYRRGGVLVDDWYYLGENAADGAAYTSAESDLALAARDTLELDNYEPVPTVDAAGVTILAQPVPVLIGPYNGQLFALGDPYRPGTVYASKPGEPDHWPPDQRHEVCSPSEQLLNGVLYAGQITVFSSEGGYILYPNLLGSQGITSSPSGCTRGLAGPWALCTGGGLIWIVATDGVFSTNNGPEDCVSDDLAPLFQGKTVNGYAPIDLTKQSNLRLAFFQRELHFIYEDTSNIQQEFIYSPDTKQWRHAKYADNLVSAYADEIANQLLFGLADAAAINSGTTDRGAAITGTARTGSWDWGRPREEKLFGDQFLDANQNGIALTWQNFLNSETVTNPAQSAPASTGIRRVIFDSFGDEPQKGRNLAVQVSWTTTAAPPTLYLLGTSLTPQPDITINRVTNWDDLGRADQSYVMGVTLDANTGGEDRTLFVERDWLGTVSVVAILTINHDGRAKLKYSWPGLPANKIRLRPDNDCGAWMCFRADWNSQPEPPRISAWDTYWENKWDQYLTGLDIYCDTEGLDKQVVVEVDGVAIADPATGLGYFTVNAAGKQAVHLTLPTIPPLRGHVLRFYATDLNPGLLYDFRWHTEAEPSEQANWNQPFTIMGTQADKWVKACIFEVDTFGQNKTVVVEADGVAVATLTVNTVGRKVVQLAFPQQLGRVWRFIPTDPNPSRLYSLRLVFDEEPFALTRWETQQIDHDQPGFHSLVEAMITLKSSADVTLAISTYVNQTGAPVIDTYTIPTTGGIKMKRQFRDMVARKGVLYKYLFTSAADFWLYQEESHVVIQPFVGGAAELRRPFGNADVDRTRSMINATLAAGRSGGGT